MNIVFEGGPLDGQLLAVQKEIWEYEVQVPTLSVQQGAVRTEPLRYRRTDRRLVQGLIDAAVFEPMTEAPTMLRISDLRDPSDPQGRSYREVNAAKTHKYPIGALVEFNHGVRLWVVHHARDCDQTPLYCLSADPNDTEIEREGFYNATWVKGIAEQYLTFIRMVNAPETREALPEPSQSDLRVCSFCGELKRAKFTRQLHSVCESCFAGIYEEVRAEQGGSQ